ncbi:MAG: efflux RND transporter periplasmic adaptor subunit [Alphaproteobacteria bacterium]|nr:efflux RND transporter periplasmic adaptor subunit [Alphaproteobacteria bacterium]
MSRTRKITRVVLFSTITAAVLSGAYLEWHPRTAAAAKPAQAAVQMVVPVSIETLAPHKVRVWSEFSGTLTAVDYAEVRPEVSGRITEVRIRDGQTVHAGDVLYVIDPRPFEAAVAKAEANLASGRNTADRAQIELTRATTLIKTQAIAQRIYDDDLNGKRVADASVLGSEAELKSAQVDLDHAYIKAPISGRLGRVEVTLGNVVQSGPNAPVLTSIVSNDGIYADFDVDEQTYLQNVHTSSDAAEKDRRIPVQVTVRGDEQTAYKGTIYSFDNKISNTTGTIRARAKLDNRDGRLVPGMFVTVRLGSADELDVLSVPDRAIGYDQNKTFVLVASANNKVAYREITLGHAANGRHFVLNGLTAGDRVIVDGIQHVQPGMAVAPREEPPASNSDSPQSVSKAG